MKSDVENNSFFNDREKYIEDFSAKSITFFARKPMVHVNQGLIQQLKLHAQNKDQKTMRICLHPNAADLHHDMLIYASTKHYIPPHLHPEKSETIHILQGQMAALEYQDTGRLIGGSILHEGEILRIAGSAFVYLIVLKDSVYLESKPGPWSRERDMIVPRWAPDANDPAAVQGFKVQALKQLGIAEDGCDL